MNATWYKSLTVSIFSASKLTPANIIDSQRKVRDNMLARHCAARFFAAAFDERLFFINDKLRDKRPDKIKAHILPADEGLYPRATHNPKAHCTELRHWALHSSVALDRPPNLDCPWVLLLRQEPPPPVAVGHIAVKQPMDLCPIRQHKLDPWQLDPRAQLCGQSIQCIVEQHPLQQLCHKGRSMRIGDDDEAPAGPIPAWGLCLEPAVHFLRLLAHASLFD